MTPEPLNNAPPSPWLPSLGSLLLLIAFAYGLFAPVYSGDLGWQIRAGQALLDYGDVPRVNFLTFTAPLHTWVAHEWASGALFAWVDRLGGVSALLLLRGVFFALGLVGLYRLGRYLGACPLALTVWMIPASILMALHTALRPWHISHLLTLLTLYLCYRIGRAPRLLWALPFVLGVWGAFHGGYVWGGAIVGAYGLQWFKDGPKAGGPGRLALIGAGALTVFLLLLGPYGTEAIVFPFRYLARDVHSGIGVMYQEVKEWAPPDLTSLFGVLFLGNALLAAVGLLRLKEGRLAQWLIHILFFYMAIRVQRHIPLFVLASVVPISLGILRPIQEAGERRHGPWWRLAQVEGASHRGFVWLSMGLLFLGASLASRSPDFAKDRLHAHPYPVEGAAFLRGLRGGNVLNHYDWGGYLPWQAPNFRAFITPVPDSYPAAVFEDWLTLANLKPGWEEVLGRYDIDAVAFPPSSALAQTLARDPQWEVGFEDPYALILLRRAYLEGASPPAPAPEAPQSVD